MRERIEVGLERWGHTIARRPILAILLCILFAVSWASQLPKLGGETAVEACWPRDSSARIADDDTAKAIQLGQRAVALDPGGAPKYNFLALAYAVADKLDEAIEAAQRAVELSPNGLIWAVVLSRLESARGEETVALEKLRHAEQLFPEHINPTFLGEAVCA